MLIKIIFGFIAFQAITLNVAKGDSICDEINESVTSNDCECVEGEKTNSHIIICKGNGVTDADLDFTFLNYKTFFALVIQNTSLKEITQDKFNGSTFEQIFIENNRLLESIDGMAFKMNSVKNLVIRNNIKLDAGKIFELAKALSPKERIEFEGNNLTKVPDNAFGDNPSLKFIFLQNNNIKSIGANAFTDLPNLSQIGLNDNSLIEIEGLNLTAIKKHNVSIFLHNNNMTETCFGRKFKYVKEKNVNIKLFLENNKFNKVPLSLKAFLEGTENQLYFHNNGFNCDKDMRWVKDFQEQVFNVWCDNLDDNINRVIL